MIEIKLDTAELERSLKALSDFTGGRMDKAMREVANIMKNATEANFETEGARIGELWKKSQRAIKNNGKTLQDTGRLAGSIAKNVTHGPNWAIVGTNVEYGPIHQFGGTIQQAAQSRLQAFRVDMKTGHSRFAKRKRANFAQWTNRKAYAIEMPARPFLGLNQQDITDIDRVVRAAIFQALKQR